MRLNGYAFGWFAVTVLIPQVLLRGNEGADAANAGVEIPPAVTDPVYVGWDRGCVVYRLSRGEGKWLTWRGPRAFLSRTVIPIVGPHVAAALSPGDGYGGWLFDLHAEKWAVVPKSPIAPPRGVQDPIAAAFVGEKLIVWGADDGDVQVRHLTSRR